MRHLLPLAAMAAILLSTNVARALDLPQCTRLTHVSHGGEADHRALDAGWVAWTEWWAQEGAYTDLKVADCAGHRILTARVHAERVGSRHYDRREAGVDLLNRYIARSPAFYALDDLAQAFEQEGLPARVTPATRESCACAALHPTKRGELTPFALN